MPDKSEPQKSADVPEDFTEMAQNDKFCMYLKMDDYKPLQTTGFTRLLI